MRDIINAIDQKWIPSGLLNLKGPKAAAIRGLLLKSLNVQIDALSKEGKSVFDKIREEKRILILNTLFQYIETVVYLSGVGDWRDKHFKELMKEEPALSKQLEKCNTETIYLHVALSAFDPDNIEADLLAEIYKSLSSPEYNPPADADLISTIQHLIAISHFYAILAPDISSISVTMVLCVDLAMAKLIRAATRAIGTYRRLGKKLEMRFKSKKVRAKRSEEKAQIALDLFYRMSTDNITKNRIARMIQEKMIAKGILPKSGLEEKPKDHTKQIKRYLEDELKKI